MLDHGYLLRRINLRTQAMSKDIVDHLALYQLANSRSSVSDTPVSKPFDHSTYH